MDALSALQETGLSTRGTAQWPNTISFPKELRDAIPFHSDRALLFDAAIGTPCTWPVSLGMTSAGMTGLPDGASRDFGPRACAEFSVQETGKLNGQFSLLVDLDTATMRALGEFLIDLANRAESKP